MRSQAKQPRRLPHAFVLEALEPLHPEVRRIFSGFGVYVGERLVLLLRDQPKFPEDNGIWLVLSESADPGDPKLREEFASIRPVGLLGGKIAHWLVIPSDGPDFESEALHACERLLARDPRFGRIPASRR